MSTESELGRWMKERIMNYVFLRILIIFGFILSCSDSDADLNKKKNKLAVQIIKVEHPAVIDPANGAQVNPQELLHDYRNTIIQYPVLYVEVGSVATNVLTKPIELGIRYTNIENQSTRTVVSRDLGLSLIASVFNCENDIVDLKLNFIIERQTGYEEFPIVEGSGVVMPKFETLNIETKINSAPLRAWIILGGLGEKAIDKSYFYILRISHLDDIKSSPLPLVQIGFERTKESNQQVDPTVTTPVD